MCLAVHTKSGVYIARSRLDCNNVQQYGVALALRIQNQPCYYLRTRPPFCAPKGLIYCKNAAFWNGAPSDVDQRLAEV